MVAYLWKEGELQHQSFVGISSITQHSVPTTMAFLKCLVSHLKTWAEADMESDVTNIHIINDSSCLQYRNRSIMKVISQSDKLIGAPIKTP